MCERRCGRERSLCVTGEELSSTFRVLFSVAVVTGGKNPCREIDYEERDVKINATENVMEANRMEQRRHRLIERKG